MFTKYGLDNVIIMMTIGAVLLIISFFLNNYWIKIPILVCGLILILTTIIFFRDPDRNIPKEAQNNNAIVLAPADGKIMGIIEIVENDYIKSNTKRISIFLSPLDVHVNRSPVTGKIEFIDFIKGKFMAAYNHEASDKNEQSKIGVMTDYGKVLFKQIVGVMARRVVYDVNIGDSIHSGDRFGMMKFGSRMDVFLPLNSEILSKVGDRIVAGETIIAKLK